MKHLKSNQKKSQIKFFLIFNYYLYFDRALALRHYNIKIKMVFLSIQSKKSLIFWEER